MIHNFKTALKFCMGGQSNNNSWIIFTVVFHFPTFMAEGRSTHNNSSCDSENIGHVNYFLQIYLFDPSVWHSNSDLWRNSDDCLCDESVIYHDQKISFENVVIFLTNHFFVDFDNLVFEIIQTWLHHFYLLVFFISRQTRTSH